MPTTATTVHIKTHLDVIPKYEALVKSAFGVDGAFIRTKENIVAMFENYSINSNDQANIISNILGSFTSAIATNSMNVALQWATEERRLAIQKEELQLAIDSADKDDELKAAQVRKLRFDSIAAQMEAIRMFGNYFLDLDDNWKVIALTDDGKVISDISMNEDRKLTSVKERQALDDKLLDSRVMRHKVMAETYINYGYVQYEMGEAGALYVQPFAWSGSLSQRQMTIAEEQSKGYTYNAWSNALTSSAGMIGTALASEADIEPLGNIIAIYTDILGNLYDVTVPSYLAAPPNGTLVYDPDNTPLPSTP